MNLKKNMYYGACRVHVIVPIEVLVRNVDELSNVSLNFPTSINDLHLT
jgi:hypothetical protein